MPCCKNVEVSVLLWDPAHSWMILKSVSGAGELA